METQEEKLLYIYNHLQEASEYMVDTIYDFLLENEE